MFLYMLYNYQGVSFDQQDFKSNVDFGDLKFIFVYFIAGP